MTGKTSRGSLIFGIVLILIGALFLLENWLGFTWVWSLLATWWPLFLIAIGLRKIIRYFNFSTR